MKENFKKIAATLKQEFKVYKGLSKDPRTPKRSKMFLALALGYLALPFDLIPDFIPLLGQLDDAVIVPGLIYLALKNIPKEILEEHRKNVLKG